MKQLWLFALGSALAGLSVSDTGFLGSVPDESICVNHGCEAHEIIHAYGSVSYQVTKHVATDAESGLCKCENEECIIDVNCNASMTVVVSCPGGSVYRAPNCEDDGATVSSSWSLCGGSGDYKYLTVMSQHGCSGVSVGNLSFTAYCYECGDFSANCK